MSLANKQINIDFGAEPKREDYMAEEKIEPSSDGVELYDDTLPPDAISAELAPVVARLGLEENCRQLATEGWTVVENAASPEFNARLREAILRVARGRHGDYVMLVADDPVFAEAVLNPKLMALAEFSVGRGFLLSQAAASVRDQGAEGIRLHVDQNWVPAPFPEHNMLITMCWVCDGYTREGGATMVVPGSHSLRRHPNRKEQAELKGGTPIECPPGSVAMWNGSLWHASYPRRTKGQRVVYHISYTRLMCRPIEDYGAHAGRLIAAYGEPMSQLLGKEDFLMSPTNSPTAPDYLPKLAKTFNNSKR